jgi:hypothetical protein
MTTAPEPQVRRATGPADLLALAPTVLGFHPEESVVVMTVGAAAHPFHCRVDLPGALPPVPGEPAPDPLAEASALGDHLARTACRHGVDAVALLLYTERGLLAEHVADVLAGCFERAGVTLRLCIRADGRRWFGLLGSAGLVPVDGTPYDLTSHAWTAEAVVDGRVTYTSREALRASLVGADPGDEQAVALAALDATGRIAGSTRGPDALGPEAAVHGVRSHLVAEAHWVRGVVRAAVAGGDRLPPEDAGRLLVAILALQVRDVAWAEMSGEDATAHVELWRDLTRRAPEDLRAAPAALLGFAAWLAGDGALAWCAVDRCRESDPDYRLGALVAQALEEAVPPSTWEPFDADDLPLFAG